MGLRRIQQSGRAAFTLVELLVVIGIMAVLATISIAGYNAASRGMASRGVIQSTISILRIAQQACEIDRVPTKVLFFNRNFRASENEPARCQGTAIAIKQAGRITIAPKAVGGLLIDEFADWHQSYSMKGNANAPGMRVFRMTTADEGQNIQRCSVMVQPFVTAYKLNDWLIQAGMTIEQWCDSHKRTAADNRPQGVASTYVPNGNNYVWGFAPSVSSSGGGLSTESWEAGDPYGVEIARVDLTQGYIFGTSKPDISSDNTLEPASIPAVNFDPEEFEPQPKPGSVPVSMIWQGTEKVISTIDSSMMDDRQ